MSTKLRTRGLRAMAVMAALTLAAAGPALADSISFNFNTYNSSGSYTSFITLNASTQLPSLETSAGVNYFQSQDGLYFGDATTATCGGPCAGSQSWTNANADLYYNDGADNPSETGLGVSAAAGVSDGTTGVAGSGNKIGTDYAVAFLVEPYLFASVLQVPVLGVSVQVGDVNDGEAFAVYGLAEGGNGLVATELASGTGGGLDTVNLSSAQLGDNLLLAVSATSGDVLLNSVTYTVPATTPEPSTWALLGTGLLLLGGLCWRRRTVAGSLA